MPIKRKGFVLKCSNVTKRNFCLHLVSMVVLCKQRPSPANKPDAVVSRHHQWCTQLYEQGASRSNVVGSQLVAHWIRHHIKNMPEMHTQAKICCTSGGLENVPKCFFSRLSWIRHFHILLLLIRKKKNKTWMILNLYVFLKNT